jgi:hypothetical protein
MLGAMNPAALLINAFLAPISTKANSNKLLLEKLYFLAAA